jgi:hypothetical protein
MHQALRNVRFSGIPRQHNKGSLKRLSKSPSLKQLKNEHAPEK